MSAEKTIRDLKYQAFENDTIMALKMLEEKDKYPVSDLIEALGKVDMDLIDPRRK